MSPVAPSASATATAKAQAAATAAAKKAQQAAINAKIAALSFFGLDNNGVPTGFSVTDEDSSFGKGRVTKGISTVGTSGILINNQFITGSVGPNVLIDQLITSTETSIERLANGQHLITSTSNIGYLKPSTFAIPTGSRGYDLADAPATITTRVLLNSGKTTILAQAVQVKNK
jgi:hypothetical protein